MTLFTSSALVQSVVAQAPAPPAKAASSNPWAMASGGLFVLLVGLGATSFLQYRRMQKRLKFEEYKNRELQKKVQRALQTITKMERNPDLIHSREFNLDYLRMRMEEETFHFSIVNQIKIKVKQQISIALRPHQAEAGLIGVASKPRAVDEIFDVEYALNDQPGAKKRVLFRLQIRLAKLPTQATSNTINQLIECVETFLGPEGEDPTWQPTIQGRIAYMHWDQKAKPTPLLVIEQSSEGVNVTLRSKNRLETAS